MAQGDFTLFDFAPHTCLTRFQGLIPVFGFPITNQRVAKYDDKNTQLFDYQFIDSIGNINFWNSFIIFTSGVATLRIQGLLIDSKPEAALADRLFQILIGPATDKLLGYIDVTPDGGTTPWNLQKVPMSINFSLLSAFSAEVS